jgi:hypothetical protein
MQPNAVVTRNVVNHHITITGDPRPRQPVRPAQVPEGGATLAFVLAALLAVAWAGARRHRENATA